MSPTSLSPSSPEVPDQPVHLLQCVGEQRGSFLVLGEYFHCLPIRRIHCEHRHELDSSTENNCSLGILVHAAGVKEINTYYRLSASKFDSNTVLTLATHMACETIRYLLLQLTWLARLYATFSCNPHGLRDYTVLS